MIKVTDIERMWINQPSTLQPDHVLNGTRVLAVIDKADAYCTVFFLDGPVHSSRIARLSLSPGWPASTHP